MNKNSKTKADRIPFIRRIFNFGIGTKIAVYYVVLLVFTLFLSFFYSQKIYSNIIMQKLEEVSQRTLDSVLMSIHSSITNVDVSSYLVIYNEQVQQTLIQTDQDNYFQASSDPNNPINQRIREIYLQNDNINSVYIYNNAGFAYSGYRYTDKLSSIDVKAAPWYDDAIRQEGSYIIRLNAGNQDDSQAQGGDYISVIRIIYGVNDLTPIGVSIVNMPVNALWKPINDILQTYHADVRIRDENDHEIVGFTGSYNYNSGWDDNNTVIVDNGKKYFYSYLQDDRLNWHVECVTSLEAVSQELSSLYLAFLWILLFMAVLVSICAFLISRSITNPIKRLMASMEKVNAGEFFRIPQPRSRDEISQLTAGYNSMITRIQLLIDEIIQEQKQKRKYELDVLHEQVKPHFLYNTFDSISYLAVANGNHEIYDLICALGNYYKTSLSKGNEIITLEKELEIVKDYLFIMGYRYRDLFQVFYDIDGLILETPVLRLILQPFVENAIYHGIKPKGKGILWIIAKKKHNGYILLSVQDDGIGMDSSLINSILRGDGNSKSFGIRSAVERLRLFYSRKDIVFIESKPGDGTKVTLMIPQESE